MAKEYFNEYEYRKICAIRDINPTLAEQLYIEYLEKYPNDYFARCSYIDQLVTLNKLCDARENLYELNEEISKDEYFKYVEKDKMHHFKYKMQYTIIRLLMYEENYTEALRQIMEYKCKFLEGEVNFKLARIICLRKLGKLNQLKINNITYVVYQFLNYSEEALMNHIKCHFAEKSGKEELNNYFTADFPIDEVVNEVRKYIPSENAILTGTVDSTYYFKYDSCGRYERKIENFFKVVCFYKTDKIITMYPIDYGENLPYIDLNYMKPKEEKYFDEKKDNDQISKFYKRLSKKKPSN